MYERLSIDTVRRTITLVDSESGKENQPLELNRSEYNLLLAFCDSHGEVLDKQTLIELGWPGRVVGENSLAVAIMKLRKKLDSLNLGFEINNLPGEGYVFINAKNVGIEHENGVEESTLGDIENTHLSESAETDELLAENRLNVEEALRQPATQQAGIKKLIRTPLFWEISLGIIIGAVTFFFIYREAFECFDCFGGLGG
ncbi:winged helix-turn-helix domain-containing protein [Vibrio harveyi]|uniref:Winged helix family transcriptional regulator n=1 Tax=Vibrio harveyi TaxID=669 RepID=A0A8B3DHS5_VIBHA|nr:winged helix-turn-helix domain-containing protein [Vibrio harveyi]EKO3858708.1 winged helix-turn-helix transcriptional regulator [Vibrio harveyi]RIW05540.1 winged helix family transcriptional regulator [Vibrio harveyi]